MVSRQSENQTGCQVVFNFLYNIFCLAGQLREWSWAISFLLNRSPDKLRVHRLIQQRIILILQQASPK